MRDALEYLNSLNGLGSIPGLESITALLNSLGNPQNEFKAIHIAGTNGKGSVGAFIDNMIINSGYNTGRFLSPAVISPYEIIRYNGQNISKEEYDKIIYEVSLAADFQSPHPTRFEVETAAAFLFFKYKKIDIAIIECGMGGLLDSTNVISNVICSVITSISMDHMAFLGSTLREIAVQKAGIIKSNSTVIVDSYNSEILDIFKEKAESCNAGLIITRKVDLNSDKFEYEEFKDIILSLPGLFQRQNAALAIEAAHVLKNIGYKITEEAARRGLENTIWPGRFQKISSSPLFIVDGAHNPGAAKRLAESIKHFYPDKKFTFLIGIFKDKDIYGILDEVMVFAKNAVIIETPGNPRAESASDLSDIISSHYSISNVCCNSIKEGINQCFSLVKDSDGIISFGSLSNICSITEEVMHFEDRQYRI